MERKLVNQKGSEVVFSTTKWPGFMFSFRYSDGSMHIMFIRDAEAEIRQLKEEGYIEVQTSQN